MFTYIMAFSEEIKLRVLDGIERGLYYCIYCEEQPAQKMVKLRQHYESKHPHLKEECGYCYNRFTNDGLVDHLDDFHEIAKKADPFYVCQICFDKHDIPNVFPNVAKMRGHNKSRHPKLKYECNGCNTAVATKSEMKSHCT